MTTVAKKIFLDTETTGLEPDNGDRVVEIAAIAYDARTCEPLASGGEYHQYLNPDRAMPQQAMQIHGLSDDFLADKPRFADIADSFIDFIRGGELIIHNADFDCGFLNAELKRIGKPALADIVGAVTCSLTWSRNNNPDVGAHNLNALCRHYNIDLSARRDYHSALVDTRLLGELYFLMRRRQGEMKMAIPALKISARGGAIPIVRASAEELQAHRQLLADMEKETGTTPIYQQPRS